MLFTMIVCNDVLDIFIHFIDNDPRADIGTPVFMTDLSDKKYNFPNFNGLKSTSPRCAPQVLVISTGRGGVGQSRALFDIHTYQGNFSKVGNFA